MPIKAPVPCAILLLILLPCTATAESGKGAANPYKLQIKNGSDYRLNTGPDMTRTDIPPELASKPYAREIADAARASGLDPVLVHALIHVESRHQKNAVSPKGAVGLMQVLPETAQRFGISEPARVGNNLKAGTKYLRVLLDRFDQRLDLALAAYNAGEGVVDRYQGIPPFSETRAYVPAVMENYAHWRQGAHASYKNGTVMQARPAADIRMMR